MTHQIPFPGMPGGIQLGWSFAELEREDAIAKAGQVDPHPDQTCFPGFGVLPGGRWRRFSAPPTGLEDAPVKQLDLWRLHVARRRRPWSDRDHAYKAEILARSIDVSTAYTWRNGAPAPAWFDGLIPRKLREFVALLWGAYVRRTYGVADRQAELAAKFDVTRKTIGNWVREGGELGLIRRERLWRETEDGDREWDICLYRIGPLLEVLAGIAAFEFSRPRGSVWMRVAYPGALPRVRVTQELARERAAALREASRRATFLATGEVWADRAKLAAGPDLYLGHLADVLADAPRPMPNGREGQAEQFEGQAEPALEGQAEQLEGQAEQLEGQAEPALEGQISAAAEANITPNEPEITTEITATIDEAARGGNAFAQAFLAANAAAERRKRKKLPSTPALLPPLSGGEGELCGEPGGAPGGKDERRAAASPSFAAHRSHPSTAGDRGVAVADCESRPIASPPSPLPSQSPALGGGRKGARADATAEVLRAVRELADPETAKRLADALPSPRPSLTPEKRRQLLAELRQLSDGEADPWAYSPPAEEYLARRSNAPPRGVPEPDD